MPAEVGQGREHSETRPPLITSADTARPRSTRSPPKLVTPRLSALPRQTSHDPLDMIARPLITRHRSQRTASLYSSTPVTPFPNTYDEVATWSAAHVIVGAHLVNLAREPAVRRPAET
jgi:hypothetical protein